MVEKKGKIHIGTSGWHYKHWIGTFYPQEYKPKDFMSYYLQYYRTVELNSPFYRLPTAETFSNWRKQVPEDFIFAVKASRFITHMKKLKDTQEALMQFISNVNLLEEKLGVILFQLPPGWQFNEERLKSFIKTLPKGYRYTFEFRNHSWYNPTSYQILKENNIAFCIYELEYHTSPLEVTADYVYVRLHGPERKYAGNYSEETLGIWADRCNEWKNEGKDIYLYFDNDQLGYAAYNGIRLKELVREREKVYV